MTPRPQMIEAPLAAAQLAARWQVLCDDPTFSGPDDGDCVRRRHRCSFHLTGRMSLFAAKGERQVGRRRAPRGKITRNQGCGEQHPNGGGERDGIEGLDAEQQASHASDEDGCGAQAERRAVHGQSPSSAENES
jgi:hypothetical protein